MIHDSDVDDDADDAVWDVYKSIVSSDGIFDSCDGDHVTLIWKSYELYWDWSIVILTVRGGRT